MHSRWIALASFSLLPLILLAPTLHQCSDPGHLDDPERFAAEFEQAHDRVRAETDTHGRAPLAGLRWSAPLAASAQEVADRCRFEHSHGRYGENLYARPLPTSPSAVVRAWAGEVDDWSRVSNDQGECEPGKMCGHYTQIVWRETHSLGCAVARCDATASPFRNWDAWTLWVCHYDPPGNLRGRAPF